jgi:protein TonB
MHALRVPIAVVAAGLLTSGMFWLLWYAVGTALDVSDRAEAQRIEFSRMRRDTEVVTKRDEKVERERPPPTPETPRMAFSATGIDNNVATLAPNVDARGAMSRLSMTAGSDRDVIPLVRINPDYPPRAQQRGIEGYVIVQFTITATGTVKDAIVVEAMPRGMFDDAALKAIARWRYNPKVEGGTAVERVGIRTRLTFQLEQ